jgi:general L-amino acid transport system permease protein
MNTTRESTASALRTHGMSTWLREELFNGPLNTFFTLAIAALLVWAVPRIVNWALVHAVFRADAEACRAIEHAGACWGVINEKLRAILFGRYPYALQWRPGLALLLLAAMAFASAVPRLWRAWLLPAWIAVLALFVLLMHGGLFGLATVPSSRWGGLPLTLVLSIASLGLAFPLGVLLALGRRSPWPVVRSVCITYIELIRGVPLISVLFMASFMLPLLLPQGWQLDVLLRVLVGITLFNAAYLAEVVRGGLQAVPDGQWLAARALGLRPAQVQRHIVMPQALRAVVPALVGSFIGTFKDSSLVVIVSLYELTGALTLALGGDPTWRPFYLEGYLFIAAIYWAFCFAMSRYSRWIERRLDQGAPGG